MSEEEIKKSIYISEIPKGGVLEIRYEGKVIAKRKGSGKIEK